MSYKVEPTARVELDDVLNHYVCSTCWGPLDFKYEDDHWYVLCRTCGEETTGYASKAYADRRREQSEQELIEAEHNLREIMNLHKPKQTVEKNLSDLGF